MSVWKTVKRQDVELSEDGDTIEVYVGFDKFGNYYFEIPIDYIKDILK